jgi:hypothetical protein
MNKPANRFAGALVLGALLAFGTANATTISLVSGDFVSPNPPSNGGTYNSMSFIDSGVTAVARAGYYNASANTYTENSGSGYPKLGWWSGNGIGVYAASGDDHTVDNKGVFDYVHFSFSEEVAVQSVTISCLSCDLSPGADAAYLAGLLGGSWTEVSGPSGNLPGTFTFNLNLTEYGTDFRFGASQVITQVAQTSWVSGNASNGATCDEYNRVRINGRWTDGTPNNGATCKKFDKVQVTTYKNQYDDFKIKAISFLTCDEGGGCLPPDEFQVPEPASLGLMGLGALMLAARSRRRKA